MHRGLVIPLGIESRLCGILFSQMEVYCAEIGCAVLPYAFSQMNNSVGYTKYLYAKTTDGHLIHRRFRKAHSSSRQSY